MPRVVWKGAISFGLVHVPIVLHPGARRANLDFDWIDRRDMAPVGYRRINKVTGKAIESEFIVKGYQYEKGEYVLMSDEDFRQANPTATQTVDIQCFVKADALPPYYFETPYYLVPDKRGDKGYALLRETLRRTKRVGIANVVLHTKAHLAAVMVVGDVLLLNTMRYADEIIAQDDLKVPPADLDEAGVSDREIDMASKLVEDMTEPWRPDAFHDAYREDLLARIERKVELGETRTLTEPSGDEPRPRAKVIDLMSMLQQSIASRAPGKSSRGATREAAVEDEDDTDEAPSRGAPAGKSTRKTTARKTAKSAAKSPVKAATRKTPAKKTSTNARKAAAKTSSPARRRAA